MQPTEHTSAAIDAASIASLGVALELRLAELARLGIAVGPGERATVWALLAELTRDRAISTIEDFEPFLACLLARSPEQAMVFDTVEALRIDPVEQPPPPESSRRRTAWQNRKWLLAGLSATVLLASASSAVWIALHQRPKTDVNIATIARASEKLNWGEEQLDPVATVPKIAAAMPADAVARILSAAGSETGGARSVLQLAQAIEFQEMRSRSATARAFALAQLSGAPVRIPLDLRIADGSEPKWIARLAQALDLIERPSKAAALSEYQQAVSDQFGSRELTPSSETGTNGFLVLSPAFGLVLRPVSSSGSAREYEVVAVSSIATQLEFAVGDRLSAAFDISRLPDAGSYEVSQTKFGSGQPQPISRSFSSAELKRGAISVGAPSYTPYAAVLVPIVLGVLWLLFRYRAERAFLRRRTPIRPPTHTDHVSDVLDRAQSWTERDRRLAQLLQTREERVSPELDIERSIEATLKRGGRLVTLEQRRLRPSPDYLILLEKRDPEDQVAARMRALITPLQRDNLIQFDIYTYQNDPAFAAPIDGGPYQPIEAIHARFPDHRLIILGSGRGLVSATGGIPAMSTAALKQWERRVLLTPTPLSEWTATEFAIAAAIDAPVGRATREGLLRVGDLLGLDGAEAEARPDPKGDQGFGPLPELMRHRIERLFYETPPVGYPLDAIMLDLRRMCDRDGFRWLCALAVYPVLKWDLTLYLGIELGAYADNDRGDRRISALTRLPWLRKGSMPAWLRRSLIEQLTPPDSADVYRLIVDALRSSERPMTDAERRLVLRVARDAAFDPIVDPKRPQPLEDRVLLDFLEKGDQGDFPLPRNWRAPSDDHRRAFIRRGATWRVVIASLAIAFVAWKVSPSPNTPVPTGGWLPLAALSIGFGVILLLEKISKPRAKSQRN